MSVSESAPSVGYVLKRYPRFSETFVVNEILALEATGVSVEIFALGPVEETHFQEAISRVRAPVRRIRHQFHDRELFWQLLQESHQALPGFRQNVAQIFEHDQTTAGQALVLARKALAAGLKHLHAHFGTQAATVARLAALFAGIHYSFTAHAKDIYHQYDEPVNLDEKIRDSAFTVTVSDYNLAHLRQHHGARADNTHRIYNGLDLSTFTYQAPETRPPHIVGVGRLVEKKGFPFLIEAMGILRDRGIACHCTLVGAGPQRALLEERINSLNLQDRVQLPGVKTQPQVIDLLRNAAMMVAPCIISQGGDRDGLPTILVEAMALGVPCISTRVVGIPELIRDQDTGLCVEPESAGQLADAIADLLAHPDKGLRLARNARQLIEQEYDARKNTQLLRSMFEDSIARLDAKARTQDAQPSGALPHGGDTVVRPDGMPSQPAANRPDIPRQAS
ncbi:MAG: glycosyltransferase family 4 protein [Lautropia sp.]|nr:glycosyltransferase family 4 protein [Lautropia sp.]